MKKASTGTSSGRITGPSLTPAQRKARDLAKARKYLTKAHEERVIAHAESALGHKKTAAHDMKKAMRDAAKAAKEKLKAAQVGYACLWPPARPGPGGWVPGGNDRWPTCLATATANSLLAVTGHRASLADVLALHTTAGGTADAGPLTADLLHELLSRGLGGVRPRAVTAADVDRPRAGTVAVVLAPRWQPHAVAVVPGGVVAWGDLLPDELLGWTCEAWEVTW